MADITRTAADGHTFSAHRAEPEGTPLGGVVVIQEIFGVNGHIRDVADRFAAAGYLALAPALFDRVETGVELDYDVEGMTKGRSIAWEQLSTDHALADLVATADALADELGGPGRVGAVGFCFGGMLAAAMACRTPEHLGAAVAYYPSRAAELLTDDDQLGRPLQIHLGGDDGNVTPEQGETLAHRWATADVHSYDGADHGFNCDRRASHHPEASALAWERTLAFLATNLGETAASGGSGA